MRPPTRGMKALVLCAGALLLPPSSGWAAPGRVRFVEPVSPPNPFAAGCGRFAERFRDSPRLHFENEPTLAVNPEDPRNLVMSYRQTTAPDLRTSMVTPLTASFDGGRSWTTPISPPGASPCSGTPHDYQSDPWVTIGPDGVVYAASLPGRETAFPYPFDVVSDLVVNTSSDGGRSFRPAVVVADDRNGTQLHDKEVLVADPSVPGTAYMLWIGSYDLPFRVFFARTADGGATWSEPEVAYTSSGFSNYPMGDAVALDDGTVLAVAAEQQPLRAAGPAPVRIFRSADRGDNWSSAVVGEYRTVVLRDPDTGEDLPSEGAVRSPSIAAADGGRLVHVVWAEIDSVERTRIRILQSRDRGLTWSPPRTVATVEAQAFLPKVAVMRDGTVGILHTDFRRDVRGDEEITTDVWLSHSHDGGRMWEETRVAGPFDSRPPDVLFNEYQSMVGLPHGFGLAFPQARPQATEGPMDVFYAEVSAHARCAGRWATGTTTGTRGDDVLVGTRGDDHMRGRGGDDSICGRGGNDRLRGGRGEDRLRGGRGRDRLRGGPGRDACAGGRGRDVRRGC